MREREIKKRKYWYNERDDIIRREIEKNKKY